MTLMARPSPRPRPDQLPAVPFNAETFRDLTMSQLNGVSFAAKHNLGAPISIGIDGDRVKAVLPFTHALTWANELLEQPRVEYPHPGNPAHSPEHGYVLISGQFGGCRWELSANPEPCTATYPCPPCAEAARFEQATRSARLDALIATDELPAVTR